MAKKINNKHQDGWVLREKRKCGYFWPQFFEHTRIACIETVKKEAPWAAEKIGTKFEVVKATVTVGNW